MTDTNLEDINRVMAEAEMLFSAGQVEAALDDMAVAITHELKDSNPLVLCALTGGIVPTGLLLPRLQFPLQLDYVHVTRYQGNTSGGKVEWLQDPKTSAKDRTILIIDDILDHGLTLANLIQEYERIGAKKIYSAVLVDKDIDRQTGVKHADFTGLKIPNRYVFGYGMDYKTYLRNGAGIFAVKGL